MNFKHEVTVRLGSKELEQLIIKALQVPSGAKVYFDLAEAGDQRDSWKTFSAARVVYTIDPSKLNNNNPWDR